jgi:thioredoxin 1
MSKHVADVGDGDFAQAVLQSEQPVLVDFWAAWCGPCRMLAPTVEAVAEQYAGAARVVKVNADENPETAARYGVRGLPTLILFKGGKEYERIVGAAGQTPIARMIDRAINAA